MLFILYYNLSSIKNYLLRLDLKNKRKLIYYVKKVLIYYFYYLINYSFNVEILENNYVTFDFVEIPNGFCNLKSYDFKCSLNDSNNTSEEKMNNFISWLVTHTQLHESQKFIYFLKVKNN